MTETSRQTRSICPYCGVGCGVLIESRGNQITGVKGDPEHPANYGRLCTKGATLHLTASAEVTAQARLLQPMLRLQRDAPAQAATWETALAHASSRFADIIARHGPDAVGFYVSGQLLTEDYYVFNKLARGLVGTNNIDSNSRLCMSSAVVGYKHSLGVDAPSPCYEDIDHAQCIFIAGSNTAYAHPVLFRRIEAARAPRPGASASEGRPTLIVVDPRKTDTAQVADLHLQIEPGTDVALFNGMLHLMLREQWVNPVYIAAHTQGIEALQALVQDYAPERVAALCGVSQADLLQAARCFAQSKATLSLYCQGLNQSSHGTANNTALINLHLACGHIGRPGAGPLSLTGQGNAMGGREVGAMANLLSAHRDLANPQHRAEVAALWGLDAMGRALSERPGKTAVEMFQAAADGEIKALWIACTNPAQSMPDQNTVRRALQRAEFVVLQEAFATTATAAFADLLLPATTWGEKDGTVTNSERRISRVRAAIDAPGQARHDWQIVVDFANRPQEVMRTTPASAAPETAVPASGATGESGFGNAVNAPASHRPNLFPYTTAESIWQEHRASTQGRDLDITGLGYALLESLGPQQWPFAPGQTQGTARLYTQGDLATPSGKAQFIASAFQAVAQPTSPRYPYALTTGRLRDQWHGMSRTGTAPVLYGHAAEPCVQMHPADMRQAALAEGDLAYLTSARGTILAPVQASQELAPGQAFMAMHWGEEFLSGAASTGRRLAGVNALTNSAYCPQSKQPELKHTAIKILKAELPWSLLAMAWLPADQALRQRAAVQQLLHRFPFASCVLFASHASHGDNPSRSGLVLRASGHDAPSDDVLLQIEDLMALNGADVLRYADKRKGQRRAIHLVRGPAKTTLQGFILAGDTQAQGWIATLLQDELDAQPFGRALLAPSAKAPRPVQSRGKAVCSCFNVSQSAITQHLSTCTGSAKERLASLQRQLQCGTNCGSCVPELQRLVQGAMAA